MQECQPGKQWLYFESLISYLKQHPKAILKAVTRIDKKDSVDRGDYYCIDIVKIKKNIDMVIYESAYRQRNGETSTNSIERTILEKLNKLFDDGKIKDLNIRTSVVGTYSNKKFLVDGSARYAIAQAKQLYQHPEMATAQFTRLNILSSCAERIAESNGTKAGFIKK